MAVAGWVLPMLWSDTVSPDAGQVLMASGIGVTGGGLFGMFNNFGRQQ